MTQHEINNLLKLLMSGDESNILMAKAICEGHDRIDLIMICYRVLRKRRRIARLEHRKKKSEESKINNERHWQNHNSFCQVVFKIDEDLASWVDGSEKDYKEIGWAFDVVWSQIESVRIFIQETFEEWKSNSFALSK